MFTRLEKLRSIWPLTITIALVIVIATFATYTFTKSNAEKATLDELAGMLNNASIGIERWTLNQKKTLEAEAASPLIKDIFQDLAPFAEDSVALQAHAKQRAFATVSRLLHMGTGSVQSRVLLSDNDRSDIFIISQSGHILASTLDDLIGDQINDNVLTSFQTAISTNQIKVIHETNVFTDHHPFDPDTRILLVAPVYASPRSDPGLLVQVMDKRWVLTELTKSESFRDYGEIYAINQNGLILTNNRLLSEHPLYNSDAGNIQFQNLFATDPTSADGALIRSAISATRHFSGHNISGYTNYRGQNVVGRWTWLAELGIGLIVEEDTAGAFAGLHQTRTAFTFLSVTLIMLLIVLSLFIQHNQNRIRKSRKQISEITNNIPGVVFRREMTPDGKSYFTFISRNKIGGTLVHNNSVAARQMDTYGRLSTQEALQLYPEINRLVHPDDLDAYNKAVIASAKDLKPLQHVFRLKADDGRIKWFKDMSTPFLSHDGLIVWNGIWLDVSEQHKAETALRNINETLELRVIERTQELAKTNADMQNTIFERERAETEALRAKDEALLASRSKSEFLANMSHELRTPLNAIIGFSDLMGHEKSNGMSSDNWMDYIKYVSESGQHLLSLINDILDYAKAESGRDRLDEHVFPVEHLIKRALRLCLGRAQPDNISLETIAIDDLLSIKGDEKKLKQVIINLVGNAIKFSKKGSKVEVHANLQPSGAVEIHIKDYGIGIANDDLAKVFEPFGQANNSLNRGVEGTGLGLPLSRALIELHGGTLHLESQLGHGTTAVIYLPPDRVVMRSQAATQSDAVG